MTSSIIDRFSVVGVFDALSFIAIYKLQSRDRFCGKEGHILTMSKLGLFKLKFSKVKFLLKLHPIFTLVVEFGRREKPIY